MREFDGTVQKDPKKRPRRLRSSRNSRNVSRRKTFKMKYPSYFSPYVPTVFLSNIRENLI